MMANTVDMQQLLMSIDPSSGNQELFNTMSKGGLLTSGGSASPSSLASSGAPSSSSVVNEGGNNHEEKDQNTGSTPTSLFSLLMQQQQQQQQPKVNGHDLMELLQQNPQLLEMIAQSGSTDLSALAGHLAGAKKTKDNDGNDDRDGSVTPTAATIPSSLAGIMMPTTSHHNSTDSAHQSVIVNGGGQNNDEDEDTSPPSAKKAKVSDDNSTNNSTLVQNTLDNILLAQISSLSNHLTGQQQNPNKLDKDLLFGGLFPQTMAGIPLMFQSPLQQFTNLPDFDSSLAALSTPNKSGAVKRQYSSNGKNYCNLCNKEVCNKYFLRTHMLKMHGIVIDENKTVIANIDTLERERLGNLSFRCDTCMVEFRSRTDLRTHKQDVHGVLPVTTPRSSNGNGKPSMPSTPTLSSAPSNAINGMNGGHSTSLEEKCKFCDMRVPSVMMGAHVQQEHLGGAGGAQLASMSAPDLTQVMALFNQAARGVSNDSDDAPVVKSASNQDPNLLKCTKCQYATKDQRNLELHQERHEQLNEAKRRGSDEDEDEALKRTTEAALKMVVQNQFDGSDVATAAALNLSLHKGVKKEVQCDEEKTGIAQHERNSHTSGSISPSGDSLPEGFGKPIGNDKNFPVQTFIVRSNDDKGCFLGEFIAQLPVRSLVDGPRQIVFELLPTSNATNGV